MAFSIATARLILATFPTLSTTSRKLVDVTGAHVVLTSSWRVDPIGLYAARFYQIPFHDVCPDMPTVPRRM